MAQVILDPLAADRDQILSGVSQPVAEIQQIAAIGKKRVARRAGFGGLRIQKGRDPALIAAA